MADIEINKIKIAISGKSGCGNTTVSKMVAQRLGLRFVNFTFRNLAEEKGITFEEMLSQACSNESFDKEVDTRQVALAMEGGGCVLGSRLAIWMLHKADLKVYMKADSDIRAQRILKREGGTLAEVAEFTKYRDGLDHERYVQLYNIDNDDYSFADLIIDAGILTPEEITQRIVEAAMRRVNAL